MDLAVHRRLLSNAVWQAKIAENITEELGKTTADAMGDVFRGLGASLKLDFSFSFSPCNPAGSASPGLWVIIGLSHLQR